MNNPLYKGDEIKQLIPQRDPIIMVDTFIRADETGADTSLTIKPGNIFCDNNMFLEPGIIEHIAQSASAYAGYKAALKNEPAPVGFIGEVKKFKSNFCPNTGDTLHTSIRIMSEAMSVSLLKAETTVNGEIAATCHMKIFRKE